jgi:rhodanese-related sulfurtransferase
MNEVIIDVRERDEFEAERAEYAINAPLSQLSSMAPGLIRQFQDRKMLVMCASGQRALMAEKILKDQGSAACEIFRGGMMEWKKAGMPTIASKKSHLSALRQTQIIMGTTVLVSSLLAVSVDPRFAFLAAFFGCGALFAGISGNCHLANLLARAPWNKV